MDAVRHLARRAGRAAAGRWAGFVWFVKGVVGANAYDHYLAYHYGTRCEHPVLSEREFWRQKMAEDDRNPAMRCC